MNIQQSNIRAKKITLVNHELKTDTFNINPKYYKDIIKLNETEYNLKLMVEILNTKENPFPLDITVLFEVEYKFQESDNEREIYNFLNVNAIQIVFPFMRSSINSIVTSALLPPLILPIVGVNDFVEKKL